MKIFVEINKILLKKKRKSVENNNIKKEEEKYKENIDENIQRLKKRPESGYQTKQIIKKSNLEEKIYPNNTNKIKKEISTQKNKIRIKEKDNEINEENIKNVKNCNLTLSMINDFKYNPNPNDINELEIKKEKENKENFIKKRKYK